jgi:hypothetical protein
VGPRFLEKGAYKNMFKRFDIWWHAEGTAWGDLAKVFIGQTVLFALLWGLIVLDSHYHVFTHPCTYFVNGHQQEFTCRN